MMDYASATPTKSTSSDDTIAFSEFWMGSSGPGGPRSDLAVQLISYESLTECFWDGGSEPQACSTDRLQRRQRRHFENIADQRKVPAAR